MVEYIKANLLTQIKELQELLQIPEHSAFIVQSGKNIEDLHDLFRRVKSYERKWGELLYCNHDENPDELIAKWNELFESDNDEEEEKAETQILFNRTVKFLRSLITIPNKPESIRRISSRSLAAALEKVSEEQTNISAQLEEEKNKTQPNQDTIRNLERLKQATDEEIEKLHLEKDTQEFEEASENDWNEKIKDAFSYLHESFSDIQNEKDKVDTEYHMFLFGLIIPTVVLLIWLCKLYGQLIAPESRIEKWMDFLPYYLPVPIFIALFWIFIVQKNRASKLAIALSERLYQIKYLEGLLMTINRLSPNSDEAISRINQSIDVVVNAFVSKIGKGSIDEETVEELEKKEISQDIYLKVLGKLTDFVKK